MTRSNVVFFVLLGLLGVLVIAMVSRGRDPHVAPSAQSASASASAAPSAAGSASALASSAASAIPGKPKPKLGRTLRVVGLGWDAIAAGVLANGGLAATDKGEFGKAGVQVSFEAVDSPNKVEKALARGGADEEGADVAILPLPTFVAGWERLRALNLAAFHVVAWSRGRDVLISKQGFAELRGRSEVAIAGSPGDSATFLGLFALDLVGVEPGRITLGDSTAKAALVARRKGSDKNEDKQTDALLSTADASRLIPWVAVAQRSLVVDQPDTLIAWAKGWHAGRQSLDKDAASAARTIGALDGAPEPLTLLERLGDIAPLSLAENAELFALSGRGAITLEELFDRCFEIWKSARVLSSPSPERAPISDAIVAGLARAEPKLLKAPASSDDKPKAAKATKIVLTRRVTGTKLDDDAVITELGALAGIFHRSQLKLTLHGAAARKADEISRLAIDRYALAESRIALGKAAGAANVVATIEVLEAR